MTRSRRAILIAAGVMLLAVTVVVFVNIDRDSHSVSDTLRPFVLTMAPVWVIAIAAGRRFGRRLP